MENLRIIRQSFNKTQKDLSTYLRVDRSTYAKYETGDSEPNFDILTKLAEYFNVTTDYLIGRDEKEQKEIHPSQEEERIIKLLETNPDFKQLVELAISLPEDQQKSLLDFATYHKAKFESELKDKK